MNHNIQAHRAKKRKSGWGKALLIVLIILLAVAGCGYLLIRTWSGLPVGDPSLNILLIGEDKNYTRKGDVIEAPGRTDTIMLMVVPVNGTGATLISIPRDTLVKYPSSGVHRINASIATGGIDLTRQLVSDLLGLPVHRYMKVDFGGFVQVVDAIGGVDITVDKHMKYTDKAGGYSLDLVPGEYHMDGELALKYVRYRQDALGDISRAARQQEFMKAVIQKVVSWEGVKSARAILNVLEENTETDMTARDMFAVGWRFRRLEATAFETHTLPGCFKGPYWDPDKAGIEALVESVIVSE